MVILQIHLGLAGCSVVSCFSKPVYHLETNHNNTVWHQSITFFLHFILLRCWYSQHCLSFHLAGSTPSNLLSSLVISFITGPPTHSIGGPVLFCSLASVVVVVCNTPRRRNVTHQGAARAGWPVVLRPVRATPCFIQSELRVSVRLIMSDFIRLGFTAAGQARRIELPFSFSENQLPSFLQCDECLNAPATSIQWIFQK